MWHETCVVRANAAAAAAADNMYTRGSIGSGSDGSKALCHHFYCVFAMKKLKTKETINQHMGRVKQNKWTENQFHWLTNPHFEAKLMRYNEMSCMWPSQQPVSHYTGMLATVATAPRLIWVICFYHFHAAAVASSTSPPRPSCTLRLGGH